MREKAGAWPNPDPEIGLVLFAVFMLWRARIALVHHTVHFPRYPPARENQHGCIRHRPSLWPLLFHPRIDSLGRCVAKEKKMRRKSFGGLNVWHLTNRWSQPLAAYLKKLKDEAKAKHAAASGGSARFR